jgi:hypothetical protein
MCELCDKVKASTEYSAFMAKMLEEDKKRIEFSKKMVEKFSFISLYSSIEYPATLIYPMFDARRAYAVPNNYFQQAFVDGEQLGCMFSHGAMRSLFFVGKRLMLFSKNVSHDEGEEFLGSFLLMHFEPNEYKFEINGNDINISADCEKAVKNLITGKNQKIKVSFNFSGQSVENRIVSRERVMTSTQLKTVYNKYSSLDSKMASVDMQGYAITVPHFAPHPYLLQLAEKLGYESGREMQEKAVDYFKAHLK